MKQAVVFIHGIGEQKPMETLRKFVVAVLPPAKKGKEQFFSKPDPMSELFELRRLQATGGKQAHFYEYYWAYQVEGTTFSHLFSWLKDLMFRKKKDIPPALRTIWITLWILTISIIVLTLSGGFAYVQGWYETQPMYGAANISLLVVLGILQAFLIHYAGDAARYLSSSPKNIKLRQRIRKEGIELLKQLHQSRMYDRIIIVGHSLGSVIAYDLITHFWINYNTDYEFYKNETELETYLSQGVSPQAAIRHKVSNAAQKLTIDSDEGLEKFRTRQVKANIEQRKWGNKWRITDLITLGSPLAHAVLLQASSKDEFEERTRQRELPTCPPIKDKKGYVYSNKSHIKLSSGKKFCPLYLHHAAPFAVTRWTNIYFPAVFGIFGDLVGGPLRSVYGLGIKDIPVKINSLRRYTIAAHTSYWENEDTKKHKGYQYSLQALKDSISLEELRKFKIK